MEKLQLTYEAYVSDLCSAIFAREVVDRGLLYVAATRWRTDADGIAGRAPGKIVLLEEQLPSCAAVIENDEWLCVVYLNEGFVSVRMASREPAADSAWDQLRAAFPAAQEVEEQAIDVRFWRQSEGGARSSSRSIKVPTWQEIRGNYARATAGLLSPLFDGFRPGENGQLILWHGPPGTGKTYALRALGWEWRNWCRLEYVIDPDRMLTSSNYLVSLITYEDDDDVGDGWRLLVLEDTGELLTVDAKEQTGQGLSRLLNLVDGILGQGIRLMILVTTNEPLRALHPAVSRPGRCAAEVYFAPFTAGEARDWARRAGRPLPATGSTLAELFDSGSGIRSTPARRAIGF